jgi:hypothetical protein
MSVDLIVIHVLFIVACAFFSYRKGKIEGSEQTVEVFLEKKLVTEEQLMREFGSE